MPYGAPPRPVAVVPPRPVALPVPARLAAPAVSPAVAAALAIERERSAALLAITPEGTEEDFRAAVARGDSVEAYRETLAVRTIERAMQWMRGG